VILPDWTQQAIWTALKWWLRDTCVSLALALFPLMVLGIISSFPAVGHNSALRAVPLVALVLYLPWLSWDVAHLGWGDLPIDPFARRALMRQWRSYRGNFVVRLIVALFCLPALTVLALRVSVPGFLMMGLAVLPMLGYAISVGMASFVQGITAVCFYPVPALLDRVPSGDESEANRP
jgi:hypothetical protein